MELHENIDGSFTPLFFRYTRRERKEEVENWISLSEENRKIAKQIFYIHHVTDIMMPWRQENWEDKIMIYIGKIINQRWGWDFNKK